VATTAIPCPNCLHAIPGEYWNDRQETTCRGCGERVAVHVFPAFNRGREVAAAASVQAEGESSCFYHPTNRAAAACDGCGRFLCTLCDLDVDDRHLCPSCLERGVKAKKAGSLESSRTQYDAAALHLVTWPVITLWLPLFTAPAALYLTIRHWNTPMSILPRTRARLWIALLLALLEIGVIAAAILFTVWAVRNAPRGQG